MTNKEKLIETFGLYEDQINVYCNPCTNCLSTGKFCDEYDKKMHANRFGCGLWLNSEYVEPSQTTINKIKMFKHGGDILKISKELENIGIQLTMEEIESKWGKFSQKEYDTSWLSPEHYYFLRFLKWYDTAEEEV